MKGCGNGATSFMVEKQAGDGIVQSGIVVATRARSSRESVLLGKESREKEATNRSTQTPHHRHHPPPSKD